MKNALWLHVLPSLTSDGLGWVPPLERVDQYNYFLSFFLQIAKDGNLSEANDKALNAIVKEFMSTYS